MFHVEQFSLFLCVASALSVVNAEDFSSVTLFPNLQETYLVTASSCTSDTARQHVARGWQNTLLGDNDTARCEFELALQEDSEAAMAHLGLMMLGDMSQRAALEKALEEASLTPAELFYLETFLKFLNGEPKAAAEDFVAHATQYRADCFSHYWAILLGHYCGLKEQSQQLCEALLKRYPDDATAHYLRALQEEANGEISEEALASARRCTELLPESAMAFQLYGHLLFRHGNHAEAAKVFHETRQKADGALYFSAALYEATTLWCMGRDQESLDLRRELNADMVLTAAPQNDAERLWRWEVNTLPLRILVLRKELPSAVEIRLAKKAATPEKNWPEDKAVQLYRDALSLLLHARVQKRAQLIEKAEQTIDAFAACAPQFADGLSLTCYNRAAEALQISLNAVKAEFFSATTKDIWQSNQAEATKPSSRLLPPIIPKRD